jgi:hypothetical protein
VTRYKEQDSICLLRLLQKIDCIENVGCGWCFTWTGTVDEQAPDDLLMGRPQPFLDCRDEGAGVGAGESEIAA